MVSITVVLGRAIATLTGTNWPEMALRPIFIVDLAMGSLLLAIEQMSRPLRNNTTLPRRFKGVVRAECDYVTMGRFDPPVIFIAAAFLRLAFQYAKSGPDQALSVVR